MQINELLKEKNMSQYRLSKESGIAQATVADICSGKAELKKCSCETVYRISKALGVTMESILEPVMESHRPSFEVFKSNVCHLVKDKGDIDFIFDTLEKDEVRTLYDRRWYPEAFYLLAMVDYLSRENDVALCGNYNDIRRGKLKEPLYPAGTLIASAVMDSERIKSESLQNAIPEFMRFNIVECEVRDVC